MATLETTALSIVEEQGHHVLQALHTRPVEGQGACSVTDLLIAIEFEVVLTFRSEFRNPETSR